MTANKNAANEAAAATAETVRRMHLHKHSMTPNLQLTNNHMTVVHQSVPDVNPQWGIIHATSAPRLVTRHQPSPDLLQRFIDLERDLDIAFGKSAMMDICENVVSLCEYALHLSSPQRGGGGGVHQEVPALIVRTRPLSPSSRLTQLNVQLKRYDDGIAPIESVIIWVG